MDIISHFPNCFSMLGSFYPIRENKKIALGSKFVLL